MCASFWVRPSPIKGGGSHPILHIVLFAVLHYPIKKIQRRESLGLHLCGHTAPHSIVSARFLLSKPSETPAVELPSVFLSSICAAGILSPQRGLGDRLLSYTWLLLSAHKSAPKRQSSPGPGESATVGEDGQLF